jgi:hypothetical protein
MTEAELLILIRNNPDSLISQAYRLGLKEKSLELAPEIEQLMKTVHCVQPKKRRK